jgi:hypothetical protein
MALIRILLIALAFAGEVTCAISWFLLMGRIISAPRRPSVEQTVAYMNHGTFVFITPLDDSLLTWLPRIGMFFGVALFALVLWARIAWAKKRARSES